MSILQRKVLSSLTSRLQLLLPELPSVEDDVAVVSLRGRVLARILLLLELKLFLSFLEVKIFFWCEAELSSELW